MKAIEDKGHLVGKLACHPFVMGTEWTFIVNYIYDDATFEDGSTGAHSVAYEINFRGDTEDVKRNIAGLNFDYGYQASSYNVQGTSVEDVMEQLEWMDGIILKSEEQLFDYLVSNKQ